MANMMRQIQKMRCKNINILAQILKFTKKNKKEEELFYTLEIQNINNEFIYFLQ